MRYFPSNPDDEPFSSPTKRQLAFLARNDLETDVDFYTAHHRIGRFVDKRRQLQPTARQKEILKRAGQWQEGMNRGEAFDLISAMMKPKDAS